jgi:hypothetical protein
MDKLLTTPRGSYRLIVLDTVGAGAGALATVSLEHSGGLEKFAFRCRLAGSLVEATPARVCSLLQPWLEKNFESVREAALKSIRTERRLAELEPLQAT